MLKERDERGHYIVPNPASASPSDDGARPLTKDDETILTRGDGQHAADR